jgi:hypothetical protein
MPYIRFGLQKPRPGQFEAVKGLQERVVKSLLVTPGCREAWLLLPDDESGEIGRLSIWDSEDAADDAAMRDETMALRSQIGILVDGPGTERGFHA